MWQLPHGTAWQSLLHANISKKVRIHQSTGTFFYFSHSHTMSKWLMFWKISNSCDSCDTLETYSSLHYQRKQITLTSQEILCKWYSWFSKPILIYGGDLLSGHISYCTELYSKWKITQSLNRRDPPFLFIMTIEVSCLFHFIGRTTVLWFAH